MKYFILPIYMLFLQAVFSEEPKTAWLKEEWLSSPSDGKSRPGWFFDVWYGAGAMISGSVLSDDKDKSKTDNENQEVSVLLKKKEETKFRTKKVSIRINEVLFSNESVVEEDTTIHKGGIATLFIVEYFDFTSNSWKRTISENELKSGIFFIKDIGLVSPGSYYIAWTMPIEREKDLVKIVKSRNKHYSKN